MRKLFLSWYAQALAVLGLKRRAVDVYQAMTRDFPKDARAWNSLGFMRAQMGEVEAALGAMREAVKLKADAATRFNLAFVLQRAGRHDEAIAELEQAVALDPKLDRAWYGLGLSYVHKGRYEDAVPKFEEAARLQPMNPYAGYHLAATCFRLGRHERVRAEYERVKGFDPKVAERMRLEFGLA